MNLLFPVFRAVLLLWNVGCTRLNPDHQNSHISIYLTLPDELPCYWHPLHPSYTQNTNPLSATVNPFLWSENLYDVTFWTLRRSSFTFKSFAFIPTLIVYFRWKTADCRQKTNFRSWTLILNSKKDTYGNKLVLMYFRNHYNRELLRTTSRSKSLFLIPRATTGCTNNGNKVCAGVSARQEL